MKIAEGMDILIAEKTLERTPKGRPLSDYAKQAVATIIQDTKNHDSELVECLGCGFIYSVLLSSDGCCNCGVVDLTMNIKRSPDENGNDRTRAIG